MPTIIVFKKIFGSVFLSKLSSVEINIMYSLFLCLIPFYLTLSLELPFTNITIALKKGFKIIKINAVSLILFTIFLLLGIESLKIYIIPIAMSCAQLYNTFVYAKFVNNQLHFFDRDWAKMFILYGILGVLIVSLNSFLGNNFFIQLYINFLLMSLWLLFAGKDIIIVFRIIMRRGEVR
jgi:O-antigen/teichoic acid export membrane protein